MDRGIRLEFLWNDADIVEVRVSAWNGLFGGSADIYVGIGELAESAEKIKDFPLSPSDKRTLEFGAFAPKAAAGAATLSFLLSGLRRPCISRGENRIRRS
jgi:hypothetical protein